MTLYLLSHDIVYTTIMLTCMLKTILSHGIIYYHMTLFYYHMTFCITLHYHMTMCTTLHCHMTFI